MNIKVNERLFVHRQKETTDNGQLNFCYIILVGTMFVELFRDKFLCFRSYFRQNVTSER